MKTFIVSFFVVILIISVWVIIRTFKIYKFQIYLNDQGYNVCKNYLESVVYFDERAINKHKLLQDMWDSITDIPYEKMLFSFKPLKPEYWLNEKQLDFLRINKFD